MIAPAIARAGIPRPVDKRGLRQVGEQLESVTGSDQVAHEDDNNDAEPPTNC